MKKGIRASGSQGVRKEGRRHGGGDGRRATQSPGIHAGVALVGIAGPIQSRGVHAGVSSAENPHPLYRHAARAYNNHRCRPLTLAPTLGLLCGLLSAPPSAAQNSFDGYTPVGHYATPTGGAFQDAFDAAPDGRVLFLAANDVYLETAPGSRRFKLLGPLTGEGAPVLFPAFIRMRPDGDAFAVGNSAGRVGIFDIRRMNGTWFSAAHYDADWFDAQHLCIREGVTVTLLDTQSSPGAPVNPVLIENCPIAAGIGFDDDRNLFTGNGYNGPEPSDTGWIMYFSYERWSGVLNGDPVVDFEEEGILVADVLSATSIGFDEDGNLHTGGGDFDTGDLDYVGLISGAAVAEAVGGGDPADPENPADVRKLDPDGGDPQNWYDATFSRSRQEMLVRDSATSNTYVYAVTGEVTCDDVRRLKAQCRGGGRVKVRLRLSHDGHDGEIVYATVDGVPFRSTMSGGKAKWHARGWETGMHDVDLSSPTGCGRGVQVTCE